MRAHQAGLSVLRVMLPALAVYCSISGCQVASTALDPALAEHRLVVGGAGLAAPQAVESLKVNLALPEGWHRARTDSALFYMHEQWRSPSLRTAVGVTYVHMLLPLSSQTLIQFATREGAEGGEGRVIRQWTDSLGRQWFEAERQTFHMVGYIMINGLEAWINYCGYRQNEAREAIEVERGERCLDTILPLSPGDMTAAVDLAAASAP